MGISVDREEKMANVLKTVANKFRDPEELNTEQLTDPDYRLKSLQKQSGGELNITCSKCHHCR